MIPCPYCGGEVHARPNPVEVIGAIRLGYVAKTAVLFLAKRFNKWTTGAEIAREVYASDPSGGPNNARVCISLSIKNIRPRLREMGLELESRKGCPGYRLRWKDAA